MPANGLDTSPNDAAGILLRQIQFTDLTAPLMVSAAWDVCEIWKITFNFWKFHASS